MDQNEQTQTRYQDYLESEHWTRLRTACYIRDGYRCLGCGAGHGLNAHHLIYRNLYDCTVHDVMTLCAGCHEAIHQHMGINGIKYGVLGPLDVLSVLRKIPKTYVSRYQKPVPKEVEGVSVKDWNRANIEKMRSYALKEYGGVFPPEGDGPFIITKAMMNLIRSDSWIFVGVVTDLLKVPMPLAKGWSSLIVGREISKETLLECIKHRNTTREVERRMKNPDFMADKVI